jgi:hypothetical protein
MQKPPLSLRLPDQTVAHLDRRARYRDMPPRTLAQRYVEEGLRTDEHPLIHFQDGPAGRRPSLIGGPDVWEVIATVRDNDGDPRETAEYLSVALGLVQAAISYYGAYQTEIDEWLALNDQASEEAEAAWSAGQAALRP